jgi:phosphoglucosamine mutase
LAGLFGTSGIRGRLEEGVSPQSCLEIGKAVGSTLPLGSGACLASDTRLTGDALSHALISGLLSAGIDVTEFGILPTPALALLTRELGFAAGIMVTASHNPPPYNGIKLLNRDALGFSTKQEEDVESRYQRKDFREAHWDEYGRLNREEKAGEKYITALKKKLSGKVEPRFKLLIDPGNGASYELAPTFFQELGFEVSAVNNEPDGLFPGRGAEPTAEALKTTIKSLNDCGADLAICFDGDADRVVFCDRKGFLGYNEMVTFISRLAVKQSGKAKVVTTVETGRLLDAAVADVGAEVFRTKVGDVPLAYATRELDAAIGVEPVGVYILPQTGYYPESFLATLLLLSQLNDVREIRNFFSQLPPFFFEKAKIPCPDGSKAEVAEVCREKAGSFKGGELNELDGVRLDFADSWILIRASGTEPIFRVLVEANSEARLKQLMAQGTSLVKEAIARSGAKL